MKIVRYISIPEYPEDNCWRLGTLHLVSTQDMHGNTPLHAGQIGEVVDHGRDPGVHFEFAKLVVLSEDTGIPLEDESYGVLLLGEGPVLRFNDGTEEWFPGHLAGILSAVTGSDPFTEFTEGG